MTPWVTRLLIANGVVYLFTQGNAALASLLAFRPAWVLLRPWTPFTYMFVHADFFHIFFNMLILFFFGPRVEARLGSGSFLRLYLISGFGGAMLSIATPFVQVVGASAAVFGVLLAFAIIWPRDPIYIWGILPVQPRYFVGFLVMLAVWGIFTGVQDGIAHYAHLGGFLGGYIYMKVRQLRSPEKKVERQRVREHREAVKSADEDLERWETIAVENLHEVNREEVERLLHKIRNVGAASLTREERAFLDNFASG